MSVLWLSYLFSFIFHRLRFWAPLWEIPQALFSNTSIELLFLTSYTSGVFFFFFALDMFLIIISCSCFIVAVSYLLKDNNYYIYFFLSPAVPVFSMMLFSSFCHFCWGFFFCLLYSNTWGHLIACSYLRLTGAWKHWLEGIRPRWDICGVNISKSFIFGCLRSPKTDGSSHSHWGGRCWSGGQLPGRALGEGAGKGLSGQHIYILLILHI